MNHIKKCLLLLLAVLLLCSCGVQDTPAPDPQPAPAESCTIGGSFTATVRDVIPDYCLDDTTPLVAVVTEFQSQPFTVYVGEELGKKLLEEQNGQPLVFTVAPLTVDRSREEVQKLSTASLLREFNLQITDCRPAEDGELGLEKSAPYHRIILPIISALQHRLAVAVFFMPRGWLLRERPCRAREGAQPGGFAA